jgi:hypothetical protein
MKVFNRRVAAAVLALVLFLPSVALAAPLPEREIDRGRNPFATVIKKIQKIFRITINDDIPIPPTPTNPKP